MKIASVLSVLLISVSNGMQRRKEVPKIDGFKVIRQHGDGVQRFPQISPPAATTPTTAGAIKVLNKPMSIRSQIAKQSEMSPPISQPPVSPNVGAIPNVDVKGPLTMQSEASVAPSNLFSHKSVPNLPSNPLSSGSEIRNVMFAWMGLLVKPQIDLGKPGLFSALAQASRFSNPNLPIEQPVEGTEELAVDDVHRQGAESEQGAQNDPLHNNGQFIQRLFSKTPQIGQGHLFYTHSAPNTFESFVRGHQRSTGAFERVTPDIVSRCASEPVIDLDRNVVQVDMSSVTPELHQQAQQSSFGAFGNVVLIRVPGCGTVPVHKSFAEATMYSLREPQSMHVYDAVRKMFLGSDCQPISYPQFRKNLELAGRFLSNSVRQIETDSTVALCSDDVRDMSARVVPKERRENKKERKKVEECLGKWIEKEKEEEKKVLRERQQTLKAQNLSVELRVDDERRAADRTQHLTEKLRQLKQNTAAEPKLEFVKKVPNAVFEEPMYGSSLVDQVPQLISARCAQIETKEQPAVLSDIQVAENINQEFSGNLLKSSSSEVVPFIKYTQAEPTIQTSSEMAVHGEAARTTPVSITFDSVKRLVDFLKSNLIDTAMQFTVEFFDGKTGKLNLALFGKDGQSKANLKMDLLLNENKSITIKANESDMRSLDWEQAMKAIEQSAISTTQEEHFVVSQKVNSEAASRPFPQQQLVSDLSGENVVDVTFRNPLEGHDNRRDQYEGNHSQFTSSKPSCRSIEHERATSPRLPIQNTSSEPPQVTMTLKERNGAENVRALMEAIRIIGSLKSIQLSVRKQSALEMKPQMDTDTPNLDSIIADGSMPILMKNEVPVCQNVVCLQSLLADLSSTLFPSKSEMGIHIAESFKPMMTPAVSAKKPAALELKKDEPRLFLKYEPETPVELVKQEIAVEGGLEQGGPIVDPVPQLITNRCAQIMAKKEPAVLSDIQAAANFGPSINLESSVNLPKSSSSQVVPFIKHTQAEPTIQTSSALAVHGEAARTTTVSITFDSVKRLVDFLKSNLINTAMQFTVEFFDGKTGKLNLALFDRNDRAKANLNVDLVLNEDKSITIQADESDMKSLDWEQAMMAIEQLAISNPQVEPFVVSCNVDSEVVPGPLPQQNVVDVTFRNLVIGRGNRMESYKEYHYQYAISQQIRRSIGQEGTTTRRLAIQHESTQVTMTPEPMTQSNDVKNFRNIGNLQSIGQPTENRLAVEIKPQMSGSDAILMRSEVPVCQYIVCLESPFAYLPTTPFPSNFEMRINIAESFISSMTPATAVSENLQSIQHPLRKKSALEMKPQMDTDTPHLDTIIADENVPVLMKNEVPVCRNIVRLESLLANLMTTLFPSKSEMVFKMAETSSITPASAVFAKTPAAHELKKDEPVLSLKYKPETPVESVKQEISVDASLEPGDLIKTSRKTEQLLQRLFSALPIFTLDLLPVQGQVFSIQKTFEPLLHQRQNSFGTFEIAIQAVNVQAFFRVSDSRFVDVDISLLRNGQSLRCSFIYDATQNTLLNSAREPITTTQFRKTIKKVAGYLSNPVGDTLPIAPDSDSVRRITSAIVENLRPMLQLEMSKAENNRYEEGVNQDGEERVDEMDNKETPHKKIEEKHKGEDESERGIREEIKGEEKDGIEELKDMHIEEDMRKADEKRKDLEKPEVNSRNSKSSPRKALGFKTPNLRIGGSDLVPNVSRKDGGSNIAPSGDVRANPRTRNGHRGKENLNSGGRANPRTGTGHRGKENQNIANSIEKDGKEGVIVPKGYFDIPSWACVSSSKSSIYTDSESEPSEIRERTWKRYRSCKGRKYRSQKPDKVKPGFTVLAGGSGGDGNSRSEKSDRNKPEVLDSPPKADPQNNDSPKYSRNVIVLTSASAFAAAGSFLTYAFFL